MRLLLVSREFAPFGGWGAGTYASLMAQAMAGLGHDVHVLTDLHDGLPVGDRGQAGSHGKASTGFRPGVTFHTTDATKGFASLRSYVCTAQQHAYAVYEKAVRLHEQYKFDFIEFPDFLGEGYFCMQGRRALGQFAGAVMGVRLHMTMRHIHTLNHDDWFDLARAVIEHQEEQAIAQSDVLMAPSHAMLAKLREVFPKLASKLGTMDGPAAQAIHLPFALEEQQRELGQSPETIALRASNDRDDAVSREILPAGEHTGRAIVLCAGRFERRKGVQVLARAMVRLIKQGEASGDGRLANACVHLVGEDTDTGPLTTSMKEHILSLVPAALRERFVFLPRAPRHKIAAMYAGCTVACLPSIWENFPFTCQEALALGTPFVGSREGGMSEIIEDGVSGLLCKGGDDEAADISLAEKLAMMITQPALRRACGEAGPRRIARVCDPQAIATQVTQLVEHVARTKIAREQSAAKTTVFMRGQALSQGPCVSVIIPVYNTHEFVHETLASLREQTLLREVDGAGNKHTLEVLVVDDGSTREATIAALDKLQHGATKETAFELRVLREPHRGLSGTRNAGLRAATGEFVMPVDSDDMLEATTLSKLRNALLREPRAAYATAYLRHFRESVDEPVGGWIALGNDDDLLPVINAGSNAAMMMRRELVLSVGGYDEGLPAYEDWDLCCTFADRGLRGIVVPEFLILYRLRDTSMMHGIDRVKHERLRSRLLAKHPSLSTNPGRTLRLLLGDTVDMGMLLHERGKSATSMVEDKRVFEAATILLHENLRYRIADRLNNAAKKLGVQRAVKELVKKVEK